MDLKMKQNHGQNKNELAELLGVIRESIYNAINELKK